MRTLPLLALMFLYGCEMPDDSKPSKSDVVYLKCPRRECNNMVSAGRGGLRTDLYCLVHCSKMEEITYEEVDKVRSKRKP